MKTIIIKSQKQFDKLPKSFDEMTYLDITKMDEIIVTIDRSCSILLAWGSSQPRVEARGSSQPRVEARESSQPTVVAWESSQPTVVAWESSQPRVEAWGSSQPRVEARESSQPTVVAWESSQPTVEARGSSQPRVEAWGSSQPRVEAWESASIRILECLTDFLKVVLHGFSIAIFKADIKINIEKKSKNAHIQKIGEMDWFEANSVDIEKDFVTLFKRVSKDWKT